MNFNNINLSKFKRDNNVYTLFDNDKAKVDLIKYTQDKVVVIYMNKDNEKFHSISFNDVDSLVKHIKNTINVDLEFQDWEPSTLDQSFI